MRGQIDNNIKGVVMFFLVLFLLAPYTQATGIFIANEAGVQNTDYLFKYGNSQFEYGSSGIVQTFKLGHQIEFNDQWSLMSSVFFTPMSHRKEVVGVSLVKLDVARGDSFGIDFAVKRKLHGLEAFALVGLEQYDVEYSLVIEDISKRYRAKRFGVGVILPVTDSSSLTTQAVYSRGEHKWSQGEALVNDLTFTAAYRFNYNFL